MIENGAVPKMAQLRVFFSHGRTNRASLQGHSHSIVAGGFDEMS